MTIPEIIDLQKAIGIDLAVYKSFAADLVPAVTETGDRRFTVAFIGDNRMKQLNELFRGKDTTTDVLSFPHEPDEFDPDKDNLGDIVISADQANKQAAENGLSLEGEIKQLILHGLLHLCGYDHETDTGEMNTRELELREKLGI
jgi:probable rRNA maturation factor